MASAHEWFAGARPPTLPASVVPVAVGIAVGHAAGDVCVWRALCCGLVALAIQIGTNYANDVADGVRGTDARRSGPTRLVAAGLATARQVRAAAALAFGVAAAIGLVVAVTTSYWLLLVGAASIAAGYLYTGGPRPYGYAGLGELFVFVFFGGVAVCGTTFVVSHQLPAMSFLAAVPVGLLSVALLVVNNLRDIETDAAAGKRTLAVRLGARRTIWCYTACFVLAACAAAAMAPLRAYAPLGCAALVLGAVPIRRVHSGATGRALIPALVATGRVQLIFGLVFAFGIAW